MNEFSSEEFDKFLSTAYPKPDCVIIPLDRFQLYKLWVKYKQCIIRRKRKNRNL